jgi:hypothetical protein
LQYTVANLYKSTKPILHTTKQQGHFLLLAWRHPAAPLKTMTSIAVVGIKQLGRSSSSTLRTSPSAIRAAASNSRAHIILKHISSRSISSTNPWMQTSDGEEPSPQRFWKKHKATGRYQRPIYIAATRQHVGKTTVSLAVLSGLTKRFDKIGFVKPVGQQHVKVESKNSGKEIRVDKDVELIKEHFHLDHLDYEDMSPILIPGGYTKVSPGEGWLAGCLLVMLLSLVILCVMHHKR